MGSAPSGPIEAALHAAEHGDADKLRDAVEQLVAMLADNKAVASPTSNGAVLIAHSRTEATPAGVLRGLKCPQGRTLLQKLVSRRGGADGARGWLGGVAYVLQHVGADADFVNHKAAPGGSRAAAALFDMAGGTMHAVIRDDELDDAQQLVGVAALLLHGADATQRGGKHDRTPRQKHVHGSNYHRPVVAALLERAEAVGGDAAVRELLAECPSQLVAAPGYTVVSGLPAVRAAVRDAGAPAPAAVSFDELKSAEAACGLRGRQDVFRAAAHGDRAALEKALARCAGLWRRARQSALSEPAEHGINVLHSLCKHRAGGPGRDGWLGCIAYALSVLGAERAPVVLNARDQWGRTPLFYVAAGKRSAPAARVSESQQAVAAALLLVYGADASIRGRHADVRAPPPPAPRHGGCVLTIACSLTRARSSGPTWRRRMSTRAATRTRCSWRCCGARRAPARAAPPPCRPCSRATTART